MQHAWDLETGSTNVVVAVLDTGMDITNPDLIPNLWSNPLDTAANGEDGDGFPNDVHGFNFVDNSSDVQDNNGHGSAVAGVIGAAGNNGVGVTGVNWSVSLLPVKIADDFGDVADANRIAGINYCIMLKDRGINIVALNESFASEQFPLDIVTRDAVAQAGKAGMLDIVAAGNDSLNLDRNPVGNSKYSLIGQNVITVGAVDNQFKLATMSNFGASSVDLAAPGVKIYTTSSSTNAAGLDYDYFSGTSMAAPVATGIIALEAAANPSASVAQLKQALLSGVTYDPALAASNGLPALVATSGVANAFNSVQNILNDFSTSNTTHGGNWVNYYGSQGAYVVGESTTFPTSIATVTQSAGRRLCCLTARSRPLPCNGSAIPRNASQPMKRLREPNRWLSTSPMGTPTRWQFIWPIWTTRTAPKPSAFWTQTAARCWIPAPSASFPRVNTWCTTCEAA